MNTNILLPGFYPGVTYPQQQNVSPSLLVILAVGFK